MAMSGKGDIAFYENGERLDREWHAVQGAAQEPRRARAGTRLEKNGRTVERKEGGGQRKTGAFLKYVREDDEPVLVLVPHIKNEIAGAVDVHVSHIAKDSVEAVARENGATISRADRRHPRTLCG